MQLQINIICNFAASHHFAGPWDTEGGRQHRAITKHVRNERDTRNDSRRGRQQRPTFTSCVKQSWMVFLIPQLRHKRSGENP